MKQVVLILSVVLQVKERNRVALDSYFLDELSEFTVGTLTEIGQQTVLELRVFLHGCIVGNLFVHLDTEEVLVAEQVSYTSLIDRHALFLGVLHGGFVETVPVLHFVVGLL